MNIQTPSIHSACRILLSALTVIVLAGCASSSKSCCPKQTPSATTMAPVSPSNSVIRIDAGADADFTDSSGNVWLADRGFDGGDIVTREDGIVIESTKDPALYRTEHWGMSSFAQPLPNGQYVVKLHFAETWFGIDGPGGRVFSFNVEGHEFKDFDVWVKAGGPRRAYIETVNVDIADSKLDITFKSGVDNPEINAIEIHPVP